MGKIAELNGISVKKFKQAFSLQDSVTADTPRSRI